MRKIGDEPGENVLIETRIEEFKNGEDIVILHRKIKIYFEDCCEKNIFRHQSKCFVYNNYPIQQLNEVSTSIS